MNLVLSGPSGSGKGTITELLLHDRRFKNLSLALPEILGKEKKMGLIITF